MFCPAKTQPVYRYLSLPGPCERNWLQEALRCSELRTTSAELLNDPRESRTDLIPSAHGQLRLLTGLMARYREWTCPRLWRLLKLGAHKRHFGDPLGSPQPMEFSLLQYLVYRQLPTEQELQNPDCAPRDDSEAEPLRALLMDDIPALRRSITYDELSCLMFLIHLDVLENVLNGLYPHYYYGIPHPPALEGLHGALHKRHFPPWIGNFREWLQQTRCRRPDTAQLDSLRRGMLDYRQKLLNRAERYLHDQDLRCHAAAMSQDQIRALALRALARILELSDALLRRGPWLWMRQRPYVTCFTDSWDDELMWAHYASSHHGICLVFAAKRAGEQLYLPTPDGQPALVLRQMRYRCRSQPLPLTDWLLTAAADKAQTHAATSMLHQTPAEVSLTRREQHLLTKLQPWSYEHEWRLLHWELRAREHHANT